MKAGAAMSEPELNESVHRASSEINDLLAPYGDDCAIRFHADRVTLTNSYRVRSRSKRLQICGLIARTELTDRSRESLSAEWFFHNLAYELHVRRSSARDADLDYRQDTRKSVRLVTDIFEKLHLY